MKTRQRISCVSGAVLGIAASSTHAEVPYEQPMVWIFGADYPQSGFCLGTKADGNVLVPIIKLEVETPNNSFAQLASALAASIEAHGDRPIAIWMHHFGNYLHFQQWGNLDDDHDQIPNEPEDADGVEHLVPSDFYGHHSVALLCHPMDSIDASLPIPAPPSGPAGPSHMQVVTPTR